MIRFHRYKMIGQVATKLSGQSPLCTRLTAGQSRRVCESAQISHFYWCAMKTFLDPPGLGGFAAGIYTWTSPLGCESADKGLGTGVLIAQGHPQSLSSLPHPSSCWTYCFCFWNLSLASPHLFPPFSPHVSQMRSLWVWPGLLCRPPLLLIHPCISASSVFL